MKKPKRKLLAALLCAAQLALLLPVSVGAVDSKYDTSGTFNIGNKTIGDPTANFGNQYCECGVPIGSGDHFCCWNYASMLYEYAWGRDFASDRTDDNNLLYNLTKEQKKLTVENCRNIFSNAKPGANFRLYGLNEDFASDGGINNHSLIFLGTFDDNSDGTDDGMYFAEANGDGKGTAHFAKMTYKDFVSAEGSEYYFKYVIYPGAGDYLNLCTRYDSNGTVRASADTAIESEPRGGKVTGVTLSSGERAVVTALYQNWDNEYWYQVRVNGATGYVYAGNVCFTMSNQYLDNGKICYYSSNGTELKKYYKPYCETGVEYFENCSFFPSCGSVTVIEQANVKTLPCSIETNEHSEKIETAKKGTVYSVTGLYRNSAGNYWFQLDVDGVVGYLYAGDVSYSLTNAENDQPSLSGRETLEESVNGNGTVTDNSEAEAFFSPDGKDLKAYINGEIKDYNSDYVYGDSESGIEISGMVYISLAADESVVLDAQGDENNTANCSNVWLYKKASAASSLWSFTKASGGWYVISPESNTGLALNPYAAEPVNGTNVNVYNTNADDATMGWYLDSAGDGTYVIRNAYNTSLVLTAEGSSAGSNVYVANYDASNALQRWKISG